MTTKVKDFFKNWYNSTGNEHAGANVMVVSLCIVNTFIGVITIKIVGALLQRFSF